MAAWKTRTAALITLLCGALLGLSACAGLEGAQGPSPEEVYGLSLPRVGGGQVRLSDYRGHVLMLDLFVTWSQASTPAIAGYSVLQGRYGDQGLAVVGVALDEVVVVVEPFVEGLAVPYPVAYADLAVREGRSPLGRVETLPTLLVFDRQGRLRGAFLGLVPMPRIEELVRDLL